MSKYPGLLPVAFTVFTAVTLAQTPSFTEDLLHGRRALFLENDQMRIGTLPGATRSLKAAGLGASLQR